MSSYSATKVIKTCPSCGRKFFKMRRVSYPPYRVWELRAKYCSNACRQYAYRKRRMCRTLPASL